MGFRADGSVFRLFWSTRRSAWRQAPPSMGRESIRKTAMFRAYECFTDESFSPLLPFLSLVFEMRGGPRPSFHIRCNFFQCFVSFVVSSGCRFHWAPFVCSFLVLRISLCSRIPSIATPRTAVLGAWAHSYSPIGRLASEVTSESTPRWVARAASRRLYRRAGFARGRRTAIHFHFED